MVCAEGKNRTTIRKKKVLIVDDHPIVREGLTDLINREEDLTVCGCAADAPQAVKAIRDTAPNVVTVDISLEGASGLDLIKEINTRFPDLPVLALSMHEEMMYV